MAQEKKVRKSIWTWTRADRDRADSALAQALLASLLCFLAVQTRAVARGFERWEKLVELESRPGVKERYLLLSDEGVHYKAAAILLTGRGGYIGLKIAGSPKKGPFLVRLRRNFLDSGVAVALMDSPSDMNTMSDLFRRGKEHSADIAAVAGDLKTRLPGAKVYLIGTSEGTVSAAAAGAKLGGSVVDGVVLASSVFSGGSYGAGLNGFNFSSIHVPILFVHDRNDGCFASPYFNAARLGKSYPLISVGGGKSSQSDPCEAESAHDYFGKESETLTAISDWVLGRSFPKEIR